jgi:uncharacterized protein YeaO (DUF488 family)
LQCSDPRRCPSADRQRKAQADESRWQEVSSKQQAQIAQQEKAMKELQAAMKAKDRELERCKAEGDGMRDEVS